MQLGETARAVRYKSGSVTFAPVQVSRRRLVYASLSCLPMAACVSLCIKGCLAVRLQFYCILCQAENQKAMRTATHFSKHYMGKYFSAEQHASSKQKQASAQGRAVYCIDPETSDF